VSANLEILDILAISLNLIGPPGMTEVNSSLIIELIVSET